jgi:hypothetical protein
MSLRTLRALLSLFTLAVGCGSDPEDGPRDAAAQDDAGSLLDAGEGGELDGSSPSDAGSVDASGGEDASSADAGGGCRATSECSGELCIGPDDRVCGIPPREECSSDEECGEGVCHAVSDSCSPDGVGSTCGPSCAKAGCEQGFECTASGRCTPVVCGEAYACRTAERCEPSSVDDGAAPHAITHGCVAIACANDEPCAGAGVCVNGRCQSGPGTCSSPPP